MDCTIYTYMYNTILIVGRIERNEDNAGQPARARAPQVNDEAHTHTHVSWLGRLLTLQSIYKLISL